MAAVELDLKILKEFCEFCFCLGFVRFRTFSFDIFCRVFFHSSVKEGSLS